MRAREQGRLVVVGALAVALATVVCATRGSRSAEGVFVITPPARLALTTVCATAACGVDAAKYTPLLGDFEPVTSLAWKDVLGYPWKGFRVKSGEREDCSQPMSPSYYGAAPSDPNDIRTITFTADRASKFAATLEANIVGAVEAVGGVSPEKLAKVKADVEASAKDAATKATTGSATFAHRLYVMSQDGISSRRKECGGAWFAQQVAVFESAPTQIADEITSEVANKVGVFLGFEGAAEATLQATLTEKIKAAVKTTYTQQTFLAAVAWAK
jgi:hypothetical protein